MDAPGNNQKIYINGKLTAENRSANPLTTNAGPLFLGAETYTQPAGRWWFQGMLDEGSLYSRALNPVEIKTIAGVKDVHGPDAEEWSHRQHDRRAAGVVAGIECGGHERPSPVLQRCRSPT